MNKLQLCAAGALVAGLIGSANAATVANVASGSVSAVNTFNNIILDGTNNRSNYLVFDLNSLLGQLGGLPVGQATLTITNPGFYSSTDATETFTLWDFSGDVNALRNYSYPSSQPVDPIGVRTDLRSGVSYGSVDIARPVGGALPNITIELNAAAIAAINSSLGSAYKLFALGGFSDTLSAGQLLFQTSGGAPNASLSVAPVPLPAAVWLLSSALLGLGTLRRRFA